MTQRSAVTTKQARIVTRSGKQFWVCPQCSKTIAEVTPSSIVIVIVNRRLVVSGSTYAQVCPHCHEISEYQQAA